MKNNHIPFWMIIVMNLNVMVGAGIFINTSSLAKITGSLGALSYLMVGWLVLPLVLVIAELAKIHPASEGGLLIYSKEGIAPWAGCVSVGGYAFAKTISTAVLARVITDYLKNIIPALASISDFSFILFLLGLFSILNLFGTKFGSRLQLVFVFFKALPILFVLLMLGYVFDINSLDVSNVTLYDFTSSIPIALYAAIGFETCCAIGHTLKEGEKVIGRAVMISFLMVIGLCSAFQFSMYSGLGSSLVFSEAPLGDFFTKAASSLPALNYIGSASINSFIAVSMLGAMYGIMLANIWNIFALSRELNMGILTTRNRYGIPFWSAAIQFFMALFFATGSFFIVDLQRIVVVGIVISYFLSAISLIREYKFNSARITLPKPVAYMSIFSCLYMLYHCIKHLF